MEVEEDEWPEEIKNASPEDLMTRVRMLDNDIRVSLACKALLHHSRLLLLKVLHLTHLFYPHCYVHRSCALNRSASITKRTI